MNSSAKRQIQNQIKHPNTIYVTNMQIQIAQYDKREMHSTRECFRRFVQQNVNFNTANSTTANDLQLYVHYTVQINISVGRGRWRLGEVTIVTQRLPRATSVVRCHRCRSPSCCSQVAPVLDLLLLTRDCPYCTSHIQLLFTHERAHIPINDIRTLSFTYIKHWLTIN